MATPLGAPQGLPHAISSRTFETALDDALKNNLPLLSWKSAYLRLTSTNHTEISQGSLKNWLLSQPQLTALSSCYQLLPKSSPNSKQAFETKTAAINITSDSIIPISEIKDEAVRLSTALGIDEVEALRICILEHQERVTSPVTATDIQATLDKPDNMSTTNKLDESLWKRTLKRKKGSNMFMNDSPPTQAELKDLTLAKHVKLYLSERRYLIRVATTLFRHSSSQFPTSNSQQTLFASTGKEILQHILKHKPGEFVESVIGELGERSMTSQIPSYFQGRNTVDSDIIPLLEWEREALLNQILLLRFIFVLVYRPIVVTGSIMITWCKLMESSSFLAEQKQITRPPHSMLQPLLNSIQPLISIVFVTMMSMTSVLPHLVDVYSGTMISTPESVLYIDSPDCMKLLNGFLCEKVGQRSEPVPAFAGWSWALILNMLKGALDDTGDENMVEDVPVSSSALSVYENALEEIHDVSGPASEPAQYIATGALSADLFDLVEQMFLGVGGNQGWSITTEEDAESMRRVLAAMMRASMSYLQFDEKVLRAIILSHGLIFESNEDDAINDLGCSQSSAIIPQKWSKGRQAGTQMQDVLDQDVLQAFWSDDVTLNRTLHSARCRFPYETLPFLSLIRATTPQKPISGAFNLAQEYLSKHMHSFTQRLPEHFPGTEVDDDDAENLILTEPLMVTAPRAEDHEGAVVLEPGTKGTVISTGINPPVVRWDYKYSALQYIGRTLEQYLREDHIDLIAQASVIEMLGILTNILSSCQSSSGAEADDDASFEHAASLLEEASDLLAENSDVVSVIFDLFEGNLPTCIDEKNTEFVSVTICLIRSLLHILPGRVWPFLGRSTLMEHHTHGGFLARITESVELIRGDYPFLLDCLSLYESLVTDAIRGVVVTSTIGAAGSVVGREGVGAGVSRGVQTTILETWTRFFTSILESFRGWKYVYSTQRTTLNRRIFAIFDILIRTVYGVEGTSIDDTEDNLFEVLQPAAKHILDTFLGRENTLLQLEPVLSAIVDGCNISEISLSANASKNTIQSVNATLKFCNTILRIRSYLKLSPSSLERHLYTHSVKLVVLYNMDQRYRLVVLELLETLVCNSGSWVDEPPSLLGHLGQDGAKSFVNMLKKLDGRIGDSALECAIWRFFSAVVSNKQQGFSILLVTGLELGMEGGDKEGSTKNDTSLLSIAIDKLSDIATLTPTTAVVILEAVYLAQNYWSVVASDIRKHPRFLNTIFEYVSNLKVDFTPSDVDVEVAEKCSKVVAAAYIARLMAMHIYQSRTLKLSNDAKEADRKFLINLIPKLDFFVDQAVTIKGYKPSMHGFLISNFEKKWPSCKLEKLKKSSVFRRDFGSTYFYDTDLAGKVLGWDKGWSVLAQGPKSPGSLTSRRIGFKNDVERANLNLALVDAQVVLLHAWSLLAIELTAHIGSSSDKIPLILSKTVKNCLNANIYDGLPTPISLSILSKRGSFSFILLSKLQSQAIDLPMSEYEGICGAAWEAITLSEHGFRNALSTGDTEYFRSLLRILYISLQARSASKPTTRVLQLLVEVFELVVAKGFKDLAVAAYEAKETADPADMLLIIGILQAILSYSDIDSIYHSLINHLAENDTIRAAMTLFTWAMKLAGLTPSITGDPDPVYGELSASLLVKLSAIPALAEQLAIGGVFNALSQGDISETIQRGNIISVSTPRLHRIWTQAFLPLTLNILTFIGSRISNEVVLFLRSFTRQISTSMEQMIKPKYITTGLTVEITQILALLLMLETMGANVIEEFGVRRRMLEAACDQMSTHRNWLAKMVVPTSTEEDALWAGGEEGDKLTDRIIEDVKLIRELVSEQVIE